MDFTKIRWAGENAVLVTTTNNQEPRIPLLILTETDIKKINREINKDE